MIEGEREFTTRPVAEASTGKGLRARLIILVTVVAVAVGYMIYAAFPGNALYFLTVNEFMAKPEYQDGRMLRVSGKLVDGSFQRPDRSTLAQFYLVDKKAPGPTAANLPATYNGVLPDLFFNPQSEIILQGHSGPDRVFQADTILVKCPSKYRALQEEASTSGSGGT